MFRKLMLTLTIFCAAGLTAALCAQETAGRELDVLEGTLQVHPKFYYRYYLTLNGGGNTCALFEANAQLEKIPVGSRIRVQGDVRGKLFSAGPPPTPFGDTWIIYMNVAKAQQLAPPERPLK